MGGETDCLMSVKDSCFEFRKSLEGLKAAGFQDIYSRSTFYVWAKIPASFKSSIDYAHHLLTKKNIIATPGIGFGKDGEGFIRFALTVDKNKLREAMGYARQAEDGWARSFAIAKNKPTPIDAYFESTFYMFPINALRGTKEAVDFYDLLNKELDERVKYGIGPVENEEIRIVIEGVPPYPGFRSFWNMFRRWNAPAVAATYPKVGGMFDMENMRHDPVKPWESIAEYSLYSYCNLSWEFRRETIKNYLKDFDAEALVIHGIKSCRSFTAGQGDLRDYVVNDLGYPALYVESDHQDPRYWAEAQIRNRVDAFFETIKRNKSLSMEVKA